MNKGVLSGLNKPDKKQYYPRVMVVNTDGTGLTQPIVTGVPGRNNGIWAYLDPSTVIVWLHINHTYIVPEGTGPVYVIELPVPAKRWGGRNQITEPQVLGVGKFIDFFHNPYSQHKLIPTLADQSWFNISGESNKFFQAYLEKTLKMGTGTWSANNQTVSVTHGLPYTPDPTDIQFQLTSNPGPLNQSPLLQSAVSSTTFTMSWAQAGSCYTNIVGQSNTGVTTAANRYIAPTNTQQAVTTVALSSNGYNVVPGNNQTYTIDSLYVAIDTAQGAGLTRTFTVQKNGVDTALTLTISGASQVNNSDTSHSFTCTSGDYLSLRTSASGVTTSTGTMRWSMRASTTTNSCMSLMSCTAAAVSNSATSYIGIQSSISNATAANVSSVMPTAGTIQNAQILLTGSPGGVASYQFTLYKNGSPTSMVITITGAATTGTDTTHTVSVAQGDRFYWECIPSGTPTVRTVAPSIEFVPTTPGESVHCFGSGGVNLTNSAARYFLVSTGMSSGTFSATEPTRSVITQAATWQKLTIWTGAATGAAKTYAFQLSKAGVAGNPAVTIDNSSTTGTDNTNTVTSSVGDTISHFVTPTGTPTATTAEVGVVSSIPSVALPSSDVTYSWTVKEVPNFSNGGTGSNLYSPLKPLTAGFPMEGQFVLIYEVDS